MAKKKQYPSTLTTYNVPVLAYLAPEQKAALDELVKHTRVPRSVYLREAVGDLLAKYSGKGGAK